MSKLQPDYELNTTVLTKARSVHHCTQPNCIRKIPKGELYYYYQEKGRRIRCLVCVTRAEIKRFRSAADNLDLWLERNA